MTSINRQLKDLQAQAERLIQHTHSFSEIEEYVNFSNEIKHYLLDRVDDEFTRNHILSIPDIDSIDVSDRVRNGFIGLVLSFVGGGLFSYFHQKRKIDQGLEIVREIRDKYASLEFLLKGM